MGLYISNQWSSRLMHCLGDLEIVGLERSVKFSHKSLNGDRFIIGPDHKSFTVDQLKVILQELNFPTSYLTDVLNRFKKSNQSGLGFEQNNGVSSYRLYLEFFDRYTPNPSLNHGLIHFGYKWLCGELDKMTVTQYFFAPSFNGKNLEQIIQRAFAPMKNKLTDAVISAASKSVAAIPSDNRIMTCATESTGCRRSFDVNVYESKERLQSIRLELEQIAQFFCVEKYAVEALLANSGDATLGHIAGGLNSIKDPFVTVYFDDISGMIMQRTKNNN